jgi:hypothetical protein
MHQQFPEGQETRKNGGCRGVAFVNPAGGQMISPDGLKLLSSGRGFAPAVRGVVMVLRRGIESQVETRRMN